MWQPPPASLALAADVVHIWRVDLRVSEACFQRLAATLSPAERARAARLRFDAPRRQFTVARGALRDILGRYLDVRPARIALTANPHGKPALAAPDCAWLHFNLAHSGDLALVALTRGRPLGIDVERVAPPDNLPRLVAQFFSPNENAAFRALPESKRVAAFFAGWTRKEAYIKALGVGGALPLDQFDVTLSPDEPARLLADRRHPANIARWSLRDLDPGPNYAAALALRTPPVPLLLYRWSESQANRNNQLIN